MAQFDPEGGPVDPACARLSEDFADVVVRRDGTDVVGAGRGEVTLSRVPLP
jgi:hypothetical protein